MTERILEAVQENWILLLVAYLLKPDMFYTLFYAIMSKLGLRDDDEDGTKPDDGTTPKPKPDDFDLFDLLGLLIRKNNEDPTLDATEELKALSAKVVDSGVQPAYRRPPVPATATTTTKD